MIKTGTPNPLYTTHPGEILKSEIEYRGILKKGFVDRISMTENKKLFIQ